MQHINKQAEYIRRKNVKIWVKIKIECRSSVGIQTPDTTARSNFKP
jgi:hypothetical protein